MSDVAAQKTPWHLWAVGILSLLWNAMGAFDYTVTQLRVEAYMAQFTQAQLDFFYGFPQWVVATWAIAVWFSVLGSVYLLLRKPAAVSLFWVSLVAMLATALHNFGLSDVSMADVAGAEAIAFSIAIGVVAAGLVYYSTRLRNAGVLR